MRLPLARVLVGGIITATWALALGHSDRGWSLAGSAEPLGRTLDAPVGDDPDSLDFSMLLWKAGYANREGKYDEAAKNARAATRLRDVGPGVLCSAWMNLFYASHRMGDQEGAAAALRSFDESAAKLPADDPAVIEMAELKEALGLGAAVARPAAPAPPEGDGFWQKADPAALGLDVEAIREHLALAKASGADGVLIAYRGKVVSEWYSPRYRAPVYTMSSVKSITGLLAGLLVADGKLNVDDPVSRFVPSWSEGRRGRVTVRHLLTMTSGLARLTASGQGVGMVGDKNGYVVGLEPSNEPGSKFEYSNEGVQLLSPILEKAAGVSLAEYAKDRLFRPLGMDETRLQVDEKGHAWTYADAETSLRDFARIGEMMRNKGRWQGRVVVPESWVEASTRATPRNSTYGYLWWRVDEPEGFAARGYLDTHCYVFPKLDLVIARMQSRPYLFVTEPYEPKALGLFKRIVKK